MACCFLLALLLTACTPGPEKKAADPGEGISRRYARDQYILRQRLNKKEISIADQLTLVLATEVPEETAVEFPAFSASLGDFTLKESRTLPPRMVGPAEQARVLHQAVYILEPYLSGTYTIPAMTVTYRDKSDESQATLLATEKVEIPVRSLLGAEARGGQINDISPPLAIEPDRLQQFLAAGLALLLALLAAAGFLWWQKKKRGRVAEPVVLRPDEIGLQQLERLLAENLLARGEIKLFHQRISDILRRYIENRFGLQAPERTTEEFLLEISRQQSAANTLLAVHKSLLADFLRQCDLVKFAKHEPTAAESEKSVRICREFIGMTKESGESIN